MANLIMQSNVLMKIELTINQENNTISRVRNQSNLILILLLFLSQVKFEDDCHNKVKISLALKKILEDDSNYSIKVSISNSHETKKFEFIGKTEELSPENYAIAFNTSFVLDYYFEIYQLIEFEFIKNNLSVGTEVIPFAEIMGSRNNLLTKTVCIECNNKESEIDISVIENFANFVSSDLEIALIMREDYENANSYPIFYYIENQIQRTWRLAYKSNTFKIERDKKQIFPLIQIPTDGLISKDSKLIKFTFCHSESRKILGKCSYTITKDGDRCTNEIKTRNGRKVGDMLIKYKESILMVFKDLIQNLNMNLIIGIDYTKSNGDPSDSTSLHHLNQDGSNDYVEAIKSCGTILSKYDTDQRFPVYGFGGIPKGEPKSNHCFPINFNKNDPEIQLIDNIIPIYRESLQKVTLNGPTYFAPIIKKVHQQIEQETNKQLNNYYILMLLTDGMVNDIKEVRELIFNSSLKPLSIIIIGIGEGYFGGMEDLDGNEKKLTNAKGELRQRDLVRFVKFNDYKNITDKNEQLKSLSADVLKEIPGQVEDYYRLTKSFKQK